MFKMKVDGKGFASMADRLSTIMKEEMDDLVEEVGTDYLRLLEANSPVDPESRDPGKLKASWTKTTRKIGTRGQTVELENDCGYTQYAEYGHRIIIGDIFKGWQRGHFFVKKSLNKIRRSMPKRYDAMATRIQRRLGG